MYTIRAVVIRATVCIVIKDPKPIEGGEVEIIGYSEWVRIEMQVIVFARALEMFGGGGGVIFDGDCLKSRCGDEPKCCIF